MRKDVEGEEGVLVEREWKGEGYLKKWVGRAITDLMKLHGLREEVLEEKKKEGAVKLKEM